MISVRGRAVRPAARRAPAGPAGRPAGRRGHAPSSVSGRTGPPAPCAGGGLGDPVRRRAPARSTPPRVGCRWVGDHQAPLGVAGDPGRPQRGERGVRALGVDLPAPGRRPPTARSTLHGGHQRACQQATWVHASPDLGEAGARTAAPCSRRRAVRRSAAARHGCRTDPVPFVGSSSTHQPPGCQQDGGQPRRCFMRGSSPGTAGRRRRGPADRCSAACTATGRCPRRERLGGGAPGQVVPAGQERHEPGALHQRADVAVPARAARIGCASRLHRPRGWVRESPSSSRSMVVFPEPFRAEQAEHRAGRHVQVDRVQRNVARWPCAARAPEPPVGWPPRPGGGGRVGRGWASRGTERAAGRVPPAHRVSASVST